MSTLNDRPWVSLMGAVHGFYLLQELSIVVTEIKRRTEADHRAFYGYDKLESQKREWSPRSRDERHLLWATQAKETALLAPCTEILAFKARYEEALARLFRDYIFFAAFGEARHASSEATRFLPDLAGISTRREVAEHAIAYDPEGALPILESLFLKGEWSAGYGGKQWAHICASALLYYSLPASVFIDHVVDLSHNNGLCFDKGYILCQPDSVAYIHMLDSKRHESLATFYIRGRGYSRTECDPTIIKFIRWAISLGYLVDIPVDEFKACTFSHEPLTWGPKLLDKPVVNDCRRLDCGCLSSEEDCCPNCDQCTSCHECLYCTGCDRWVDPDEGCTACAYCPNCCACPRCSHCGEINLNDLLCEHEACSICCPHVICPDCEWSVKSTEACYHCQHCTDCCSCRACSECDNLFTVDEPLCEFCARCGECCGCPKCDSCGKVVKAETLVEGICPICMEKALRAVGQLILIQEAA